MVEHCLKLEGVLEHFDNKPPSFKKAFCTVFGSEIGHKEDVFQTTENLVDLMWEKVSNGRVIKKDDIYFVRGEDVVLYSEKVNGHHWPPGSRGGKKTIKTPYDFHRAWHIVFMNLYKKEEFYIFLKRLFSDRSLENFSELYEAVDRARKLTKKKKKKR